MYICTKMSESYDQPFHTYTPTDLYGMFLIKAWTIHFTYVDTKG